MGELVLIFWGHFTVIFFFIYLILTVNKVCMQLHKLHSKNIANIVFILPCIYKRLVQVPGYTKKKILHINLSLPIHLLKKDAGSIPSYARIEKALLTKKFVISDTQPLKL